MEAATQTAASPELTADERREALARHDQLDHNYLAVIGGLSDAQWTFQPAPDRWSIQHVAEHIVLVEARVQRGVEKRMTGEPDLQWAENAGLFNDAAQNALLDRSVRIPAPDVLAPHNAWTIEETSRRFQEARAVSREMLQRPGLALKAHSFAAGPHPGYNCHGWLLLLTLHHQRHLLQMAEVKAHPAFPR
jgi:hypothetical protein